MFICFLQRGQRSFVMQYREREKGAGLPAYAAALCNMHYTVCIIYHVCVQLSIQQPFFGSFYWIAPIFGSFYWIVPIFSGCSTVATHLHENFTESTFFLSQIFLLVAKQDSFPHSTLADMTLFNTMTSHKNSFNHRMCCEPASPRFFIDKVS